MEGQRALDYDARLVHGLNVNNAQSTEFTKS